MQNCEGPQDHPLLSRLTPRQRECATLVAQGLTNVEIGHVMGIKRTVVTNYLQPVYDALGVWSRLELAVVLSNSRAIQ